MRLDVLRRKLCKVGLGLIRLGEFGFGLVLGFLPINNYWPFCFDIYFLEAWNFAYVRFLFNDDLLLILYVVFNAVREPLSWKTKITKPFILTSETEESFNPFCELEL